MNGARLIKKFYEKWKQKSDVDISGNLMEEGELDKFDTYREYWVKNGQKKTSGILPGGNLWRKMCWKVFLHKTIAG